MYAHQMSTAPPRSQNCFNTGFLNAESDCSLSYEKAEFGIKIGCKHNLKSRIVFQSGPHEQNLCEMWKPMLTLASVWWHTNCPKPYVAPFHRHCAKTLDCPLMIDILACRSSVASYRHQIYTTGIGPVHLLWLLGHSPSHSFFLTAQFPLKVSSQFWCIANT